MAAPPDSVFAAAEKRGRKLMESGPRAVSARYDPERHRIVIELANGCLYAFPVRLVQDLQGADAAVLSGVLVDGAGFNLHWPDLEVDLYVPALLTGVFGTRQWMTHALARVAGQTRSPAKAVAARANGARGGRPRKIAGQ